MSGTHRDLLFWTRSRCFACKNHRWALGPIETSNSCAKVAALLAQKHRCGLEPQQTCKSGHKGAVLHEKEHRWGLWPTETCNSSPKGAVLHAQNHRWWLEAILSCHSGANHAVLHPKNTDEGWDPCRLVSLVLKSLFCMQNPQMRAGTHRD